MGVINKDTESQRLRQGKDLYRKEQQLWSRIFKRMSEDFDFVAGEQWSDHDRDKLESEQRPALTFNLVQEVINEFVGANEDMRKRMRPVPVGIEDIAAADVAEEIARQLYVATDMTTVERETLAKCLTGGLANIQLDFETDADNPDWQHIVVTPIAPGEVLWDSTARRMNYSDAMYVLWPRWVSEAQFATEYPEEASRFDRLRRQDQNATSVGKASADLDDTRTNMTAANRTANESFLDVAAFNEKDFFLLDEHKLLIIHLEYVQEEEVFWARDESNNRWVEVPKAQFDFLRADVALPTRRTFRKKWKWLEYTGAEVLFDDDSPVPIDGFSIQPMIAKYDWATKEPYGIVRDLKDPQREVNKRFSYGVDLTLRSVQPGAVIEEDATPDIEAFTAATRTPGGTAVLSPGALAANKYQERPMPSAPAGALQLSQEAYNMFQRVAGFSLDALLASRGQETPVGTALIQRNRELMAITPILEQFREFQRRMVKFMLQVAFRVMPDDQITEILGNPQRWQVQNGVIMAVPPPQQPQQPGQPQQPPPQPVPIGNLRSFRWDVQMEAHEEDTTGSLLVLQVLMGAQSQGIAIPGDVIASFLPIPRDMRLKTAQSMNQQAAAAQQQAQAQQQLAAQAQQTQKQQVEGIIATEQATVEQRREGNQIEAEVKREQAEQKAQIEQQKMLLNFMANMAKLAATAEEGDKDRIIAAVDNAVALAESRAGVQAP